MNAGHLDHDVERGDSSLAASHCTGCGASTITCAGCGRELDPPRFCPSCGRRLTVAVSPGGYRARCNTHGELYGI